MVAALRFLVDAVLPPRCPGCGEVVDGQGQLCVPCWGELAFLPTEGCAGCNVPLAFDQGNLCGACLREVPPHGRVHAAVAYGDLARKLVLRLKYGRRPDMAKTLARLIAPRLALAPDALLVPVPLHRRRLWSRGYNQAVELARAIGRATGSAVRVDGLRRVKPTPVLKGLGGMARARAVAGAFRARERFDGRAVYLVDDVFTSGATVGACARTLKRAGAASIEVVCWTRVLPDD